MRKVEIQKTFGEVRRWGMKIEDWAWEVSFIKDGVVIDMHTYVTEDIAKLTATSFLLGAYKLDEFGGVVFNLEEVA